jgi:hypothetical protein
MNEPPNIEHVTALSDGDAPHWRANGPHRLMTLKLEPFPFRLNRNGALVFCFDVFS